VQTTLARTVTNAVSRAKLALARIVGPLGNRSAVRNKLLIPVGPLPGVRRVRSADGSGSDDLENDLAPCPSGGQPLEGGGQRIEGEDLVDHRLYASFVDKLSDVGELCAVRLREEAIVGDAGFAARREDVGP